MRRVDARKAWIVEEAGGRPRLSDAAEVEPGPGQVLVNVEATGLNFADLLMCEGRYQDTPPFPLTPGLEVAGRIARVGPDVGGFRTGDRILAYTGRDGLASSLVTDASRCLPLPDGMDAVTAAGFPVVYGTSHIALLRRGRLQAGERLVVLGAAGGVGLTAVEIGHAAGARVTAVARGEDRLAIARGKGADRTLDTDTTKDMLAALREAGPFDVVYDAIGGALGEAALRAVAPEARVLLIGFASGDVTALKANHLLVKNTDVIGVNWPAYLKFAPDKLNRSLSELIDWHGRGLIHPHVSHTFPLEEADAALDLLRSRRATGKIVVTQ